MADEAFYRRPGTIDEGKDYEIYVAAEYVLRLTADSTVTNFKLTSNDKSFGDLDDVVVEVEKEKCTERYALQLKHVNNKKKLSLESLKGEDGNFSINKYFRTFQKLSNSFPDYKFILSTNRTFSLNDDRNVDFQLNVVKDVFYVKIVKCKAVTLLNTSQKSDECFQFSIIGNKNPLSTKRQEYEQFFHRFFLYTNQANVEELKKDIPKQIKKQFSCDDAVSNIHLDVVANEYVKYISEWSKRDGVIEKLNKPLMQQVITLILLNPFIRPISFNSRISGVCCVNGKLLQEAISKFDVTIFDKELDNTVTRIFGDAKNQLGHIKELNKLSKKYPIRRDIDYIESLDDGDECTKCLWIMGKCPLIVYESPITIKAIEFCTNGRFVLLGTYSVMSSLQQYSILRDINDLKAHPELYQKITKQFLCGTPGNEFSLEELIQNDKSIETVITTNELLKMIDGPYVIEHKQETLPIVHINRSLSRHIVDFKYLETIDRETLIVISNVSNRQKIINSITSTADRKNLHLFQKECCQEEFLQLCETNRKAKRRHHFKLNDENFLEWLQSDGDVFDIERYLLDGYFLKQEYITDLQESINVISDEPGKGKSVLLKSLKNQFCSKYVVMFSRVHLEDLCATIRKTECSDIVDVFRNFLKGKECSNFANDFDKRVLNFALREDRIIYLWDAVDEISRENLNIISNMIKKLPRTNCVHWFSCRSHLKTYMQHTFCVFSRTVAQFSEEEQRFYLEKRLRGSFSDTDFDDVIAKVKTYLTFTTSDFFLGVPIQIYMLTELFISNPQKYANLINSQFLVTDLYSHSIEEKIKQSYQNEGPINPSHLKDCKRYRLPKYERAALISLFEQEFITSLNLMCEDFLEEIEQESDDYGIITEIKGDNKKPHFVHSSYAEYFAATYFVKFYKRIPTLKDILFEIKYTNIRFLFDILLAQDSAAHIAVLHKNLETLKHCENLTCRDSGGRSVLHLACSWGERYPVLKCNSEGGMYILEDEYTYLVNEESDDYTEMLEHLLEKLDPLEKDNIFNMTSLCYAKKSESLLTIAFIEKKQKINCLANEHHSMICSILCYSVMFGHDEVIDMFPDMNVIKTESDYSFLHLAADCNQPKVLRKLLSMDKYQNLINDTNVEGFSALSLACRRGNEEAVKILLDFGANKSKSSSLHTACACGHVNIVRLLIPLKDDIGPAKNNETLLVSTFFATSELLFKSDDSIDEADENGWTPLRLVCRQGSAKIAELLITSGAHVNSDDEKVWTPLMTACDAGHASVAHVLIKFGAKVNATDKNLWTPLIIACYGGHDTVADLLINSGANINAVDEDGWTPLMSACYAGHVTVANLLIASGAKIDAVESYSWTSLAIACNEGHDAVANLLLKCGANVNVVDYKGWTPLTIACNEGHDTVANLLLKSGANVNALDYNGWTPLMIACREGFDTIATLLLNSGADVNINDVDGLTALYGACVNNHLKIIDLLIKSGSKIDERNKDGIAPLMEACCWGFYDVAEMLIKYGADINVIDKDGLTPLGAAFHNNHSDIVKLLIDHGADLNHMGGMYSTPLYAHCESGYLKIVQSFIEMGADVNAVVYNGWRPIHIACYKGYEGIVRTLLEAGANAEAQTSGGDSPIDIALENGHAQVVQLLKN